MDNPPATPNVPPNAPAQPRPCWSMYMLDIDASTDTTYVLCKPKTTIILTFSDVFLSSWEAYFFWHVNFFGLLYFVSHTPYVDLFNTELNEYSEYK